ncbi:MAG: triose-phosphate isomerase [Myxococcota bacterium]
MNETPDDETPDDETTPEDGAATNAPSAGEAPTETAPAETVPERRFLIAGNWKMNAGGFDGTELATAVANAVADFDDVEVVVAPPATALAAVTDAIRQAKADVGVAGQNMHHEASGAFTGEVSAEMLKMCGCQWVILGHSERRTLFGEDDETVANKVHAAFGAGLAPIVCVGETLAQREAEETLEVVSTQIAAVLDELAENAGMGVVAYEPVWAIGTGLTASPEDAQTVHAAIRAQLEARDPDLATSTRILYGGSVKPQNAEGLLAQPDIDGALVGGASLQAPAFSKIAETASKLAQQAEKE